MLSIGKKKYRNLQEQVGFNTEQIERIFEIIDGLNIQDNVVVVPDMSYILSQEELEVINNEVAFIVYDGQLYIKKSQDASLAYFDIVFTISASTTVISFNSKEIQVTLSNGALGIVVSTSSTYSVSQIDNLLSAKATISYVDAQLALKADTSALIAGLALKANLSGANFTGEITAPSIIETMSGYGFVPSTLSGLTLSFVGAVKTGNKLTFAIAGKYQPTALATSHNFGGFTIPTAVNNKLIPFSLGGDNLLDVRNVSFASIYNNIINCPSRMVKSSGGILYVYFDDTGLTVNTDYAFRYEITFLLNDSLV